MIISKKMIHGNAFQKIKDINLVSVGLFFNKTLTSLGLFFAARYYSPEAFGQFGYYMSILSVLYPFSILGMESFLLMSRVKKNIINHFVCLNALFCSIATFFAIVFFYQFENPFLFILPIHLFMITIFEMIVTNMIKSKKTILNLYLNVVFSIVTLFFIIMSIFCSEKEYVFLIYAHLLGYLSGILMVLFLNKKTFLFRNKNYFSFYKKFFKKNINYIYFYLVLTMLDCFIQFVPIFYIKNYFYLDDFGLYFLCSKIFYLPIAIVGGSLAKNFLIEIKQNDVDRKNVYFFIVLSLFFTFLIYGFIFLINQYGLFVYFFGDRWGNLENIINLNIMKFIFEFFSFPIMGIFIIRKKQKKLSFIKAIFLVVLMFYFSYITIVDFEQTIFTLSVMSSLFYITMIGYSFKLIFEKQKKTT